MWYCIYMMNDMMPTIEETITPDIAAQIEHEEWQRVLLKWEQRERWRVRVLVTASAARARRVP